jgi:hypothetical protein
VVAPRAPSYAWAISLCTLIVALRLFGRPLPARVKHRGKP